MMGVVSGGDGSAEVVSETLASVQELYQGWMLERLGLFRVADRLVELWLNGVLPVGVSGAGSTLDAYRRGVRGRLSALERAGVYRRCFGAPSDAGAEAANREFEQLWLRFVDAVSSYRRQTCVAAVLADERSAAGEAVRVAARPLALNLAEHGAGSAAVAAPLRKQIEQAFRVVRSPDLQRLYGAEDAWELVEQVSTLDLGGTAGTVRYRTMAEAGGTIIRWLATRAERFSSRARLLDRRDLRRQPKSVTPLRTPTDRDLVDACELWLSSAPGAETRRPSERPRSRAPAADRGTFAVVRPAVERLLARSSVYAHLSPAEQAQLARDTISVASFIAAPQGAAAQAEPCRRAAPPSEPRWDLQAVDFPAFVSSLIAGVFAAIVAASIEQMRAFADLINAVAQGVDDDAEAASDDCARRWLSARYPHAIGLSFLSRDAGRLTLIADNADALRKASADLCLQQTLTNLQDANQELALVRQARLHLVRRRQHLLASSVRLGITRILSASR